MEAEQAKPAPAGQPDERMSAISGAKSTAIGAGPGPIPCPPAQAEVAAGAAVQRLEPVLQGR